MDIEFFKRFVKTKDGPRELIKKMMQRGQQNVHTPYSLCNEMIGKLSESCDIKNSKIAVLFNVEFVETLITDFGVNPANIIMFADDKVEGVFCELQYKMKWGENLFQIDIAKTVEEKKLITDSGEMDMKFDVVVGNPPYQAPSKNNNKGAGNTLWNRFVELSFVLTKEKGFVCLVHPSGWRNVGGRFSSVNGLLRTKQIHYLEIHNADDGIKTFGAGTRYDWYVAQNISPYKETDIFGEDNILYKKNLNSMVFIPNGKIEELAKIIATDSEDKVNLLYNCNYHSVNGPVKKVKQEEFVFPCVQHVSAKDNIPSCLYYSSTKDCGHFGIPKIIFGVQVSGVLVDKNGEYGMCEHCSAIVDSVSVLKNIADAMSSDRFVALMKMCDVGGNRDRYNRKVFPFLRRDFWKEFV